MPPTRTTRPPPSLRRNRTASSSGPAPIHRAFTHRERTQIPHVRRVDGRGEASVPCSAPIRCITVAHRPIHQESAGAPTRASLFPCPDPTRTNPRLDSGAASRPILCPRAAVRSRSCSRPARDIFLMRLASRQASVVSPALLLSKSKKALLLLGGWGHGAVVGRARCTSSCHGV